ncbi:hypothetical protein OPFLODJI_00843 [Aeromonas hydrophila]|uniref:hypothetical protein n=1 Tax=Aeromonas TaxID=642 RepID=UPI000332BBAE|nr:MULTISPECIES: hypothetical protein [Aeromonas]HDT5894256.1 hypothetical protein [Aeromonas hydrophila subsp. hydrophila]AGM45397.1 hypothetical protein AHML_18155 [Aeromonas hydrophila ML09-119]AHX34021.1 hypothetical protein V428_18820 [Aeromonas hydrophila subsp. hydrophila AL09-71]AHX70822.1 hypothetical protein V429_18850 [Aeromonas hydrophila pc104A]AJE35199.1 hypothetical protein V469_04445 [Aeromonas hydrophila J-1]
MRRDCMTLMALGLVLGSLLGGCADIKEAGRTVGHTTRNVTREIGHTTRDVTREIGHGTRDTVKKVGDELSK